jgi:hypothetical protein
VSIQGEGNIGAGAPLMKFTPGTIGSSVSSDLRLMKTYSSTHVIRKGIEDKDVFIRIVHGFQNPYPEPYALSTRGDFRQAAG